MTTLTDRIHGCFLGKSIGGTLGMPYEGRSEFLNLNFYQPVPNKPVPNDDLDLQIVWLDAVKKHGLDTDNQILGRWWLEHIDAHPDEYGVALWNLRKGLIPPLTGVHNNAFTHGMGSPIRSEIWAALFPGQPLVAAHYAYHDASVDHDHEGIWGEIFLAAAEAQLFATPDTRQALKTGLGLLPESSPLKAALAELQCRHASGETYEQTRLWFLRDYGNNNFTDCILNIGFTILGLLFGESDFEKSLLCAVNCGQDTDCTAATAGAWMGIILGAGGIPEKWRKPVGERIVIGEYIKGIRSPANVGELVGDIEALHKTFAGKTLPELSRPFALPVVQDISDDTPWTINGRKVKAQGIRFRPGDYMPNQPGPARLETRIRAPRGLKARVLVCGKGVFGLYLDDQLLGNWSTQAEMVPAFHRVVGGRCFDVELKTDKVHSVRVDVHPHAQPSDLVIAFGNPATPWVAHLAELEHLR
jgi:ADP-ribosylglycohydrolase